MIEGIKAMITTGELRAGSRLPIERDLAARLGVSRGPLREGVRALAMLGVLEPRQGDGTYVSALDASLLLSPLGLLSELQDPAEAVHLLAVRRVLESESVAQAAIALSEEQLDGLGEILSRIDELLRGDPEDWDVETFIEADSAFHREIARGSGNPPLAALIEGLTGRTVRARLWRAIHERGTVRKAHAEHHAILQELRRRDPERARVRMAMHILDVEEFGAESPAE